MLYILNGCFSTQQTFSQVVLIFTDIAAVDDARACKNIEIIKILFLLFLFYTVSFNFVI